MTSKTCTATRNNLECKLPAGHGGHHKSLQDAFWGWAGTDSELDATGPALGEQLSATALYRTRPGSPEHEAARVALAEAELDASAAARRERVASAAVEAERLARQQDAREAAEFQARIENQLAAADPDYPWIEPARAAAESYGYNPADVTLGSHVPGVSAGAVFTRQVYVGSMYLGTISGQGVFRDDRRGSARGRS